MSSDSPETTAVTETPSRDLGPAFEGLVKVGRLWAAHGLALGQLGIETGIQSMQLAARTLGELRTTLTPKT